MDDILLATNDKRMMHGMKQFLSKNFDMKDMGEASYVIDIKIHIKISRHFRSIIGNLYQQSFG